MVARRKQMRKSRVVEFGTGKAGAVVRAQGWADDDRGLDADLLGLAFALGWSCTSSDI